MNEINELLPEHRPSTGDHKRQTGGIDHEHDHWRKGVAIYCGLATAALCASVQAADQGSITVKFSDLVDIYKPEGAKVLYDRIRAAAQELCQTAVGRDPNVQQAMEPCVNKAIDNAVKEINAPYLTALRFGSDVHIRVTYR